MKKPHMLQALLSQASALQKITRSAHAAALQGCPPCHYPLLERVALAIEECGQDAVPVSALTERFDVAPAAVSRWLRILEESGEIARQPSPQDRRKTLVQLTPKGKADRDACKAAITAYYSAALGRIPQQQYQALLQGLAALNDALGAQLSVMAAGPDEGGTPANQIENEDFCQ